MTLVPVRLLVKMFTFVDFHPSTIPDEPFEVVRQTRGCKSCGHRGCLFFELLVVAICPTTVLVIGHIPSCSPDHGGQRADQRCSHDLAQMTPSLVLLVFPLMRYRSGPILLAATTNSLVN